MTRFINVKGIQKYLIRMLSLGLAMVLLLPVVLPLSADASVTAVATEYPMDPIRYEWKSYKWKRNFWIEFYVSRDVYLHNADLDRVLEPENYVEEYIEDLNSKDVVKTVVNCFWDIAEDIGLERNDLVREMTWFVQTKIKSANDMKTKDQEDYPRYPLETLYEGKGDAQDRSILLAAMLRELGFETAIVTVGDHFAVGLRAADDYYGGRYYQIGNQRWVYIETTNKEYDVGEIPKKYQDKMATFYFLQ